MPTSISPDITRAWATSRCATCSPPGQSTTWITRARSSRACRRPMTRRSAPGSTTSAFCCVARIPAPSPDESRLMTDVPAEVDDFDRLSQFTIERGYSRWKAIVIFLIGCIPALLAAMATQGRNGTVPLIGLLLVTGPTALMFLWTLRDRDAQEARELGMWVRVVQRAGEFGVGAKIRRELPEVAVQEEIDRINLSDTATEYREA